MRMPAPAVPTLVAPQSALWDYLELTKPSVVWLILMSTAVGYYVGAADPVSYLLLLHTLLGTALLAGGTGALNQWLEREADGKMRRTERRPLPAGRLQPPPRARVRGHGFRRRHSVSDLGGELAERVARPADAGELPVSLHASQNPHTAFHLGRCFPGSDAAANRLGGRGRRDRNRSVGPFRDAVLVAVPAFLRHCLDVPRRLRPGGDSDAAGGRAGRCFDLPSSDLLRRAVGAALRGPDRSRQSPVPTTWRARWR